MSANARAQVVGSKHLCDCSRRATYARRMRQRRRARTDHPLCERCWRSLADRYRPAPAAPRWLPDELLARMLAGAAARAANAPVAS